MKTLHITIFERQDAPGHYDVAYSYDALPLHRIRGMYNSVAAARASVDEAVAWREPDADASRDVVAVAEVEA